MLDKNNKKKKKTSSTKKSNKSKLKKTSVKRKVKVVKKTEPRIKKRVIFLTIFILLSIAIIAVTYYLIKNPKFNISAISVSGNNVVTVDEIISKSGISLGDNIIKSYFKINREDIESLPYIEDVKVSLKLPHELKINVKERISTYYAYDREKNIYYRLDENGIILEACDRIDLKGDELLVNGITFDDVVKLGTKINDIDYSKILVYEKIEKEFYKTIPDRQITKVSFENSLTTIYLNDQIEVILPNDTDLQYNLTFLKEILAKVVDVKGTINMTKENPTFISF